MPPGLKTHVLQRYQLSESLGYRLTNQRWYLRALLPGHLELAVGSLST